MMLKRVGPLSCAKIVGTLYAILGLVLGAFFSLLGVAGGFLWNSSPGTFGAGFGALMGVGAIVFFPLLYGGIGFVMSLLGAWLYNVVAGAFGGIEMDLE